MAGTPIMLHPSLDLGAELSGTAADLYHGTWRRSPHNRLQSDGMRPVVCSPVQ
ncbi:hypothetical protein [Aeromicrobium sp.]